MSKNEDYGKHGDASASKREIESNRDGEYLENEKRMRVLRWDNHVRMLWDV